MEGDVTVAVEATTVNYKDGLAITGKAPVVRRCPLVPGHRLRRHGDCTPSHPDWKAGDKVILNGWGVGETHYGAYAGPRARQGRLAGAAARRHERDGRHGGRHGRLHGDAVASWRWSGTASRPRAARSS